jgi:hypothetical protein
MITEPTVEIRVAAGKTGNTPAIRILIIKITDGFCIHQE